MSDTAPLLNLDTLIVRPKITIDGKPFDMIHPDEISVIDSHRFGVWGRRIDELQALAKDDEASQRELDELVFTVARKILPDVPDDVFAKLSGTQRWAVIDVFSGLLLQAKLKVAGAIGTATGEVPEWLSRLTGAPSFPGSSGFMAGSRRTGLSGFLRRWFARS